MDAFAFVNYGRWICECPTGDNNAMDLTLGQTDTTCGVLPDGTIVAGGCFTTATVVWPAGVEEINAALAARPVNARNWAPAGHRQTFVSLTRDGRIVAEAYPEGQTADDLLAEEAA